MLNHHRAEQICRQFSSKKVLIFGDIILDRYIFGEVNRISPEAPVPVVKIKSEEFRLGGCGNVAFNIDKLGAKGILTGITGNDQFSELIFSLKTENNHLIKTDSINTIVKTRVISNKQQIVRIDREKDIIITEKIEKEIISNLLSHKVDGIILSDYAKGTLTSNIMDVLARIARQQHIPLIVDPKPPNFSLYKGITGITPNRKEAEILLNKPINTETDLRSSVQEIKNRFSCDFSLITRGDQGISAIDRENEIFHIPAITHEVYDVTGAGDTVVSLLLLSLISGASLQ